MHSKSILFSLTFLFGMMSMAGCKDTTLFENIPVTYQKCPCDHVTSFLKTVSMSQVLLFDATKTTGDEMQKLSSSNGSSVYCVYTAKTDTAILYEIHGDMTNIGYICNWPDAMKKMDIPGTGMPVSFTADEYVLCNAPVSIATVTYASVILRSLSVMVSK